MWDIVLIIMEKPQFLPFWFQQNMKISRVRELDLLKIGKHALLYLLFISATLKIIFLKNSQKSKENSIDKLVKTCDEYLSK